VGGGPPWAQRSFRNAWENIWTEAVIPDLAAAHRALDRHATQAIFQHHQVAEVSPRRFRNSLPPKVLKVLSPAASGQKARLLLCLLLDLLGALLPRPGAASRLLQAKSLISVPEAGLPVETQQQISYVVTHCVHRSRRRSK